MEASPPVVLKHLHLDNVRCFDQLDLRFASRPRSRGQWTVLLGDNGVGKSTILKALAVALSPLSDLTRYPEGRLQRLGAPPGRVALQTSAGDLELELGAATRTFGFTPLVFAYGAARGSALGGPSRSVDLEHPLGAVGTLFNQPPGLIHAETWLRNLAFGALRSKGGGDEGFFESVCATLVGLLPGVDRIEPESDAVYVEGPAVGRTTFDGLSDGFATTIGWTCDLIARWAHARRGPSRSRTQATQSAVNLDRDFREQMTGLVLVDELDLHLHPRWQVRVIEDLRAAFPCLSFVVTTHNPLTLLGARPREIHVLTRESDGIHARQQDVPPGSRADAVLTGPWFGLASTLDADTVRRLEEYQKAAAGGATRAELRDVEVELRQRLGSFGDTAEERLALRLVAETSSELPLAKEDRADLKRRMRSLLGEP